MRDVGRYIIGALISFGIALIFLAAGSSAAYFDALEETKAEAHIIAQNARAVVALIKLVRRSTKSLIIRPLLCS